MRTIHKAFVVLCSDLQHAVGGGPCRSRLSCRGVTMLQAIHHERSMHGAYQAAGEQGATASRQHCGYVRETCSMVVLLPFDGRACCMQAAGVHHPPLGRAAVGLLSVRSAATQQPRLPATHEPMTLWMAMHLCSAPTTTKQDVARHTVVSAVFEGQFDRLALCSGAAVVSAELD